MGGPPERSEQHYARLRQCFVAEASKPEFAFHVTTPTDRSVTPDPATSVAVLAGVHQLSEPVNDAVVSRFEQHAMPILKANLGATGTA